MASSISDFLPVIRGALYGMAVCEAPLFRILGMPPTSLGPSTSMAVSTTRAVIADGGPKDAKFTYILKLREWYMGSNPDERSGLIKRSVAIGLDAWDRLINMFQRNGIRIDQLDIVDAKTVLLQVCRLYGIEINTLEGMDEKRLLFEEMRATVSKDISAECHQDAASLVCGVPAALFAITSLPPSIHFYYGVAEIACLTHPSITIRMLSILLSTALYHAVSTECHPPTKEQIANAIHQVFSGIESGSDTQCPLKAEVIDRFKKYQGLDDWKAKKSTDLRLTSLAVDVFEAALWCFFIHDNFKDGATKAQTIGGDSPVIAVIYGALAGTFYRYNGLPAEWVFSIDGRVLDEVAQGLGALLNDHSRMETVGRSRRWHD